MSAVHPPGQCVAELATALRKLGCPPSRCEAMARQLDRRARMDAERKNVRYQDALARLLGLMAQGWAAAAKPPGSV
jgi:hypothetical protein